jgi:hypothetical protein
LETARTWPDSDEDSEASEGWAAQPGELSGVGSKGGEKHL